MAEAPKRKTADTESEDKPKTSATRARDLEIGDVVCFEGKRAVVTGINKAKAKIYIDTPVCKWVPMAACKRQ